MSDGKTLDLERQEMPKQPAHVRRSNFEEVALGYSTELAAREARRCLRCKKPFCVSGCPVEIDIPGFVGKIAQGEFAAAIRILKEKNCLPAICGRVCPQEEQCEKSCILNKKGAPVAIGRLERFAAEWEAVQDRIEIPAAAAPTGKRVAVVGSGPAGITVAGDLILLGHDVTVFEALHEAGGVLTYGIPEFRLPKAVVRREIRYIQSLGVKVIPNYVVGKTCSLDQLLERFDAVFIGTGAGLPWFMNIPGENLNGVYSANEYLTRMNLMGGYRFPGSNTPVKAHRRVAVIGGGNVAMDCARTALRRGAEEVSIVYRRSRDELPARLEEVENAEEEGIVFRLLTLPLRLLGDESGWLREIECQQMELGEVDASGRRKPVPVSGSEFRIPMDACIVAIGNSPNPLIPGTSPDLACSSKGTITIDEVTGRTSKERVWAGGDIVTGAATVILAMGAGRIAARSMHEFLMQGR
ncbi:MAG: NADPH-dependent glutamate synthase [Candidatus Aminicenantes bacterium]|nr:NADPH-dependent glutamate synthase [Candidatus Aminicenantes bacterium]